MQKREFTSFDVTAVVQELKGILNSRVSNIYQLDGDTVLFKLRRTDGSSFMLLLEAGKRIHLTSYVLEKPPVPPPFCMAMRKYLKGSFLTNVEQHEFERIVIMHFKTREGNFRLILEVFGDGNIILVNDENRIIQALRYKRMRDRSILKGEIFQFPPSSGQNPMKISRQAFMEGLKNFGEYEVVRALARFVGIGGVYAEEILLRLGIDKKLPCKSLSETQIENIYNCLHELLTKIVDGNIEPNIVFDETGEPIDVAPLKLERYGGLESRVCSSFNEALDEFYTRKRFAEAAESSEIEKIRQEISRLERILIDQENMLKEAEKNVRKYVEIAEAIYQHSSQIQALIDELTYYRNRGVGWAEITRKILDKKGQGEEPYTFFESLDEKKMMLNLVCGDLRFSLDLRKNLFTNAARFYDKAKNAKHKLEGAKAAYEETLKRLEEAKAKLEEAHALKEAKIAKVSDELNKRKVKKKKWYEKFRWFISSDGHIVVAGKDAASNEVLIRKYTEPEDVVFHADILGSPFVVIKSEGKEPSEECLKEAAEFAASFSRAWREGFASVDVYWVRPEQLSKGGSSGEYVAHGAFVVKGKRNWMQNIPLRTAIGVVIGEGEINFISGPVDAVKARTNAYVVISPGDIEGKILSRQILREIAGKVSEEYRERVLKASVEEVRQFIPFNKGRILLER